MRRTRIGEPQINWEDLARTTGYDSERAMLEHMYTIYTVTEIGKRLDCAHNTVLYHLRKLGIVRRRRGGPYHRKPVKQFTMRVSDWRNLSGEN